VKVFDKTTDALAASLNFRSLRQNVTASNIANAETPGYHAKVVDFEEALSRAVDLEGFNKEATSDPDHFALGTGEIARARADVYDNPQAAVTNDGNTVDLEQEMATLKENTILYKAAMELINKKLGEMKYAITEGGTR
jgi:flagellar basal-body rod protein FlgB